VSTHGATIEWQRGDSPFVDQRYSRRHTWRFDGGASVVASSSPAVVPVPMSDPVGVDPEEAFVAALASCHMLWFLSLAADDGWVVDAYDDAAEGRMGRDDQGRVVMQRVTLRPLTRFGGDRRPTEAELHELHHRAHASCFLANSVRCEVCCEVRGAD
jgi:organic hydroperoxide reductase OsmC/OhrA